MLFPSVFSEEKRCDNILYIKGFENYTLSLSFSSSLTKHSRGVWPPNFLGSIINWTGEVKIDLLPSPICCL